MAARVAARVMGVCGVGSGSNCISSDSNVHSNPAVIWSHMDSQADRRQHSTARRVIFCDCLGASPAQSALALALSSLPDGVEHHVHSIESTRQSTFALQFPFSYARLQARMWVCFACRRVAVCEWPCVAMCGWPCVVTAGCEGAGLGSLKCFRAGAQGNACNGTTRLGRQRA